MRRLLPVILLWLLPLAAMAQPGLPAVTVEMGEQGAQTYSVTLQILILMTLLTMLPAIVLMMTSFTRIVIVLAILRQAMGTPQTPPNQVLIGLALFLTFFIMSPVITQGYEQGVQPYLDEEIGAEAAVEEVVKPLRSFMMNQVRESDLSTFAAMANETEMEGPEDVPMSVLVPAFITSELKTAFIIGFLLYIPFVIIDLVVASVLMSMGMMMLSPMLVSLPFKIMLFVLVDGWSLVVGTLASSFFV